MASITTLQNNVTGLTFRTALNDNFSTLNNDKAEVSSVTAVSDRVTVLEGQVVTSEDVTTITDPLDTRITAIEDFHNNYEYVVVTNVTVTGDVYEEIINYTTGTLPTGIYELRMSMLHTLNNTNTSAYFRFSTDGGSTWVEVVREPKDNTDLLPTNYFKIINHTEGTINIQIQAKKESAGDTLFIAEMTAAIERKM